MTTDKHTPSGVWGGAVLAHIDWSQPWFTPWAALGKPTAARACANKSVADALNAVVVTEHGVASDSTQSGNTPFITTPSLTRPTQTMVFVPQAVLPAGQAYEDFIYKQQQVPTRDGLHDFFNGLCWHRFPKAKRRLNFLQAQAIAQQGVGATRGALRDALTLFDENAVLWQGPDVVWQALQARDWMTLFVHQRHLWAQVRLVLFGHALLEKLVTPYKSITGHVYRVPLDVALHGHAAADDCAQCDALWDDWLATDLQAEKLATKPFEPLPILGVPHWWPENNAPSFYQDTRVFRPKRVDV